MSWSSSPGENLVRLIEVHQHRLQVESRQEAAALRHQCLQRMRSFDMPEICMSSDGSFMVKVLVDALVHQRVLTDRIAITLDDGKHHAVVHLPQSTRCRRGGRLE